MGCSSAEPPRRGQGWWAVAHAAPGPESETVSRHPVRPGAGTAPQDGIHHRER